ncbi:MAG: molybdenum cofactor biosynthesis protein MoaE [Gemmatimonadetes bacterium]|nr:molybdenum cofactor biosynthesis protein MoaE [Gemmatimonadota bacterium]
MRRSALVERALDAARLEAEVAHGGAGAIAVFVGTVRDVNDGRPVTAIEYSAYGPMAERELERILEEACASAPALRAVVEHRIGLLAVGEASVVIAVSHPHRAEALRAVETIIEELKQRVPIWKREHYVDGTREWVHAGSSQVTC